MSTPVFSDIAKASNDLLNKDFPSGNAKYEVSTTTANGVKFTLTGHKCNKTNAIFNELKAKYTYKPAGLTLTETINTGSVATIQVESVDYLSKGVKLDFSSSLIHKGSKFAKVGAEYKKFGLNTRTSVDLFKGPLIMADAVFSKHGGLIGAEAGYDVAEAKVTKVNYAVGYVAPDYTLSLLAFNHCATFNASYFHKVNANLEAGAKATWARSDSTNIGIEFGSKFTLDKDAFVKAKIDSAGKLGLGYTQILRPGVKLALGALVDTVKLEEAAHKIGFQLTFEA